MEVCHLASLVRSKLPMFDSSFFLARTEEGVVAPARLGQDGRYHVEGESVFAPKDLLVPALKTMAKEIFMEAKAFNKIIMSPLPRCLKSSCCNNADRVSKVDYEELLEEAIANSRRIEDFASGMSVSYYYYWVQ